MAAGHLDNSAIAIWFQPDIDFSNQENCPSGAGRTQPSMQTKFPGFMASAKQLNPSGVLCQGNPRASAVDCRNAFIGAGPWQEEAACLIGSIRVLAPDSGIGQAPVGARG